MAEKYLAEKNRLEEFLKIKGVSYNAIDKTWRCMNHDDKHESAVLYDNPDGHIFWCPVCDKGWSVFEVAGFLHGVTEFPDKLKIVREVLGIHHEEKNRVVEEKNPLPFPTDKDKINERIKNLAIEKEWGDITDSWKYYNINSNVIALDIRTEKEGERKNIITFWYDGTLKWYRAPIFIYNLHLIKQDKKILIHEGAKCADIATKNLLEFTNVSWSGGSGKVKLVDWSIIKNHDVYILPDDDDPGRKAAKKIKEQLPNAKILKNIDKAKEIKQKGADIEEILQVMTPEEFTKYALDKNNHIELSDVGTSDLPLIKDPPPEINTDVPMSDGSMPFEILGIGDDGRCAFITEAQRLQAYNLDTLSKNKLLVLAKRAYWYESFKNDDGKISWDWAIDYIIRIAQKKDFIDSDVRGRGAWRDGEKISYHDGIKTLGEFDDKKIYLRLPRKDLGITDNVISSDTANKMKTNVFKMSFETPADAVRCLGWCALAPFAGVLKYRPSILLTGPSGSGKSVVQSLIMKKLTNFLWVDAAETSIPGVRGKMKHDNGVVFFEEADKDTEKKRAHVTDIFSFMRANFTDDAPDALKGTKEGGYTSYKMNAIFGFAAVDPTIEHVADENRIFRVNMVKPENGNEWKKLEDELIKLFCEKNCRAVRALTWKKLKTIFELTNRVVDAIRIKTHKDYRSSFADALMASAFIIIWDGVDNPTSEQIDAMLDKYYSYQPADDHRSDAEEIIERLMDETIEVLHDHNAREKITIQEALQKIYKDDVEEQASITNYKLQLARYGIRLTENNNLAISNRHHLIAKVINRGAGYNKILKRHPGFIEGSLNVYFFDGGKSRRCTILKGVINKKPKDRDEDETVEALFG